jgi:signal transduction histidine kinase
VQLGSLDVREAILGLKSAGQIHVGLVPALRDYAAQFTRLTNLPVKLEAEAEAAQLPLQAEPRLQLLRIVQEALSNIRKHAVATHASLTVWREADTLYLTIADDGIGFDPQTITVPTEHIGLTIIRERAAAVGGEATVTSALGYGTEISIAVPLERNTFIAWPNAS